MNEKEIYALSVRAVNQLIADVEAKRLLQNKELAETIAVCLRNTEQSKLQTLKALLEQRELEGIPSAGDEPKWQN